MDVYTLFLAVKGLPENTWYKYLDEIVGIAVVAVFLLYMAISTFLSYRRNRFCPCCHRKAVLGLRTEKRPPHKKYVRFGKGRVYGDLMIVVHRCPKCGREIDLGK